MAHTNAFVNLNGIPYVLGEYVDRDSFQSIDRSAIYSEISVDQHDPMRAVVDINIDDIGKRADGQPNIIGNYTKLESLLTMIRNKCHDFDHILPTLRKGIIIRVFYHIENNRTGQVMRSAQEDLKISNRFYFVDVNPTDLADNCVITNFSDTMVSTMNQFTHGLDPMIVRITHIQLFYEVVLPNPISPRVRTSIMGKSAYTLPSPYGEELDVYRYHKEMQNQHFIGVPPYYGRENIIPDKWYQYNRFYHFDTNCNDIILHEEEIYSPRTKSILLAAGEVHVNRIFMINPGHRIVFKFSIWKNDVTLVNDSSIIAEALDPKFIPPTPPAPYPPCPWPPYNPYPPYYPPYIPPKDDDKPDKDDKHDHHKKDKVMPPCPPVPPPPHHRHDKEDGMDYEQNTTINKINRNIELINEVLKRLNPDAEIPTIVSPEVLPEKPLGPGEKRRKIKALFEMMKTVNGQIEELQEHDAEYDHDIEPFTDQELEDIINSLDDSDYDDNDVDDDF